MNPALPGGARRRRDGSEDEPGDPVRGRVCGRCRGEIDSIHPARRCLAHRGPCPNCGGDGSADLHCHQCRPEAVL